MPKAERLSENEQFAEKRRFEGNCKIISQGERLFGGLLNVTVDSSSEFPFWQESKNLCFLPEGTCFWRNLIIAWVSNRYRFPTTIEKCNFNIPIFNYKNCIFQLFDSISLAMEITLHRRLV